MHACYAFASYVRREGHLYEVFLVLAKQRLILDQMCRLYGKFASYLRRVLCRRVLFFSRINGPNVAFIFLRAFRKVPIVATFVTFVVSLLSRGRYCRGQKNHKQSWR